MDELDNTITVNEINSYFSFAILKKYNLVTIDFLFKCVC